MTSPACLLTLCFSHTSYMPFPTREGVLQIVWALPCAWHASHPLSASLISASLLESALNAHSSMKPHQLSCRVGISTPPFPYSLTTPSSTFIIGLSLLDLEVSGGPEVRWGSFMLPGGYRTIHSTAEKPICYFIPWVLRIEWILFLKILYFQINPLKALLP